MLKAERRRWQLFLCGHCIGSAAARPMVARAQQNGRVPRIELLTKGGT
jgi:hypothetical protein